MHRHRVEVLAHDRQKNAETWSNRSGSLVLRRAGGQWKAEVDGKPVVDLDRRSTSDGMIHITGVPMTAPSLQDLSLRLSLQHRIHVILDA